MDLVHTRSMMHVRILSRAYRRIRQCIPHPVLYTTPPRYITRVANILESYTITRVITRGTVYTTPPAVMPHCHYDTPKLSPRVKACRSTTQVPVPEQHSLHSSSSSSSTPGVREYHSLQYGNQQHRGGGGTES